MSTLFYYFNSTFKYVSAITILLIFPFFGNTQEDLEPIVPIESIDKVFAEWNDLNKPGIAVGVLSNGKLVQAKGYGSANLETSTPVTADTKFYIGEIAREFVAFSILLLENEGKLSLNDDVRKYLPDLPNFGATITLNHLINHTSGIPELSTIKAISGWQYGDAFSPKNAMSLLAAHKKLNTKPGQRQQYTNTVFVLLESIVAKVTGKPYTTFVQQHIFEPLNMANTLFAASSNKIIPNKAQGYHPQGSGFQNAVFDYATVRPTPIFSTVADMCKWAANYWTPKIGNPSIIQNMEAPSIVNGEAVKEANTSLYVGQHYYWNYRGTKKLYHVGGGNGYASKLIRNPDQNVAVIILGNSNPYNGYAGTATLGLYIEKHLSPRTPIANNNQTFKSNSLKLNTKELAIFAGDYWYKDDFFSRTIRLESDTLRYVRYPGNESLLVPVNTNTFRMLPNDNIFLEFTTNKKGEKILRFKNGEETPLIAHAYDSNASWAKNLNAFAGTYTCKELDTKYKFIIRDGQLVATHQRLADVTFRPILKNLFAGSEDHFGAIQFERNSTNEIKGFLLSAYGINDIWFERVSDDSSASILRK